MDDPDGASLEERLALLDWRRRVFALYAEVRRAAEPEAAWRRWRDARDELFATHPQSPLPAAARAGFAGLAYHPYDPAARVEAELQPLPAEPARIGGSREESFPSERFARAHFSLGATPCTLELSWLTGYAGGLLLAFGDASNGAETYGGGRYLLDTVKGAELGLAAGRLVLDFNFAYHPSCSYDPRWSCPLAPAANRLPLPLRAGERLPAS